MDALGHPGTFVNSSDCESATLNVAEVPLQARTLTRILELIICLCLPELLFKVRLWNQAVGLFLW